MIRCGECGLMVTAEAHLNRQGHHYTYYRCTKRRLDYRCHQPYLAVPKLERQILDFLQEISIPDDLHRWALSRLHHLGSIRAEDHAARRRSLEQSQLGVQRQRENLTKLRLRDLLTDEEFVKQRQGLEREELRIAQNLAEAQRAGSWFEPAKMFLSISNRASKWFEEGDDAKRRLILHLVGSNPVLKNKSLSIDAAKPFRRWGKTVSLTNLRAAVEDVRTLAGTPELADFIHTARELLDQDIAVIHSRRSKTNPIAGDAPSKARRLAA